MSIFKHEFYAPLLACGEIPCDREIPDELLQAMAVLIGRSGEVYFDPAQCREVAALVLLAIENGLIPANKEPTDLITVCPKCVLERRTDKQLIAYLDRGDQAFCSNHGIMTNAEFLFLCAKSKELFAS
jgi:hypothetical protein